ncbi:phosphate ABC transporter permease PstA [Thiomicrospira pelophila]|uniref:phosphate ABC transporter permease PstA n=1 Tax=Thiomicrospira pelophila TaxID=934 RepID=UPI0004A73C21|nr:phosphate ABC transporter permease PstA [Thiomicrospira pelophila]
MKAWFNKGEHWVWFSASAVSVAVVLVFGLLMLIAVRGLSHFWPHEVYNFEMAASAPAQSEVVTGEIHNTRIKEFDNPDKPGFKVKEPQLLIKTGNRDLYGLDFRWISEKDINNQAWSLAQGITVIERHEWGNLYGYVHEVRKNGEVVAAGEGVEEALAKRIAASEKLRTKINAIEKMDVGAINYQLQSLRYEQRKLEMANSFTQADAQRIEQEKAKLEAQYQTLKAGLDEMYTELNQQGEATIMVAGGQQVQVPIKNMVRSWQPNEMRFDQKFGFFMGSIGHFLFDNPREANTEGGVFPAIVGTLTMVVLMTLFVMPMGVIAAIYMREYAREGWLLRLVRISINNLAGVPSIVFGIFGLGFFVYVLGHSIDQMFYSYALPTPTFGTPGLLWAALTMALLTLPVVIVSTEEGLSRVPRALREGGLALGATRAEVIMRIVLPLTTPAIMTGLILAIARAAGEVAPLMLVGVVKLVSELPVSLNAPFVHLDQKFMHLGFHIYDVGFQSPNVEASQPLVYATSLLLVLVIVSLNLGAISIRNRLREKYKALEN